MDKVSEAVDNLHKAGSLPDLETTEYILTDIIAKYQTTKTSVGDNEFEGKLQDHDFEWLIKKVKKSIEFSVKILT